MEWNVGGDLSAALISRRRLEMNLVRCKQMSDKSFGTLSSQGYIIKRPIEDELKEAFLDYSMSVIVSRAIPDIRDGLKPVQRRILYAMNEQGLAPNRPYKKSATVVGAVLGKYHPHGDSPVYDALVRLAQDFSMNEPLVDGQGNFGSIDGDAAAAYRYTEARLTPVSMELLADIEKSTVDFVPTFDDSSEEPSVLPSRLPNLLLNGSTGIAVGMATNVPPHNLRELADAIEILCDNPDADEDEVLSPIQGPDFPTGAMVIKGKGLHDFYRTGEGKMIMRGRVHIEKLRTGRTTLVITEIPYGVVKSTITTRIATLVREKRLEGIADLRDESDRDGIRICIDLKRDADPKKVLARLYKYTALQTTFGGKLLALNNQRPETLSVKRALELFVEHRLNVIVRRARHDLDKARMRAHIVEGLLIAIADIDRVVAIIKSSQRRDTASKKLRKEFGLSEVQAEAILDLRLARLTSMDVSKLKAESKELAARIHDLEDLLASPERQRRVVRDETLEVAEKYGRERRTQLVSEKVAGDIAEQSADEYVRVYISSEGNLRCEPVGKRQSVRKDEIADPNQFMLTAATSERLVLFADDGRYFPLDVSELSRSAIRSRPVHTLVEGLGSRNKILFACRAESLAEEGLFVAFVTRNGQIKRTSASEYASPRAGGVIGVGIADDDELLSAMLVRDGGEIMLFSHQGQAIRFRLSDVPEQGRAARGVRGIGLVEGDHVVSASVVSDSVAVMTDRGLGKRIPVDEFPLQGRGGRGVKLVRDTERSGAIVWGGADSSVRKAWVVTEEADSPTLIDFESLPELNRPAKGEPLFALEMRLYRVTPVPDVLSERATRLVERVRQAEEKVPAGV